MAGPNVDDGAVAIDGGRIVAVGPTAEIVAHYHGKTTISARGQAVLPGFVNSHTHVPMVLFRGIADDRDLMDWLQHFIFPAEAKNVTPDFVKWGTRLAAAEMILSGTKNEIDTITKAHNGMTPGKYLDSIGFLGRDVIAAHGVWLTPDELTLFASRKSGVAYCPESNMMLASGIAPVVDMRRAGMNVGLGTDGPAGSNNNLDMVEEMASAARLQKIGKMDPKALTARDVIEMATIGGAHGLRQEREIRSPETGKRADVILVDLQEPKVQPVYSVESSIVYAASRSGGTTTICDGKILMRNGKVLTVNVPAAVAHAKQYWDKVRASLQ